MVSLVVPAFLATIASFRSVFSLHIFLCMYAAANTPRSWRMAFLLRSYWVSNTWVLTGRDCLCRDAQKLGLNALRTWAFSDGADEWNAIQPHLGELNETILSQASAVLSPCLEVSSAPCLLCTELQQCPHPMSVPGYSA